jgi:hypothetical protein
MGKKRRIFHSKVKFGRKYAHLAKKEQVPEVEEKQIESPDPKIEEKIKNDSTAQPALKKKPARSRRSVRSRKKSTTVKNKKVTPVSNE